MEEKLLFVQAAEKKQLTMTELCRAFGVSRRVGYKWLARFKEEGPAGLVERSRASLSHPNAVAPSVEDWIIELRRQRPNWGPRKLLAQLKRWSPATKLPAHSTVSDILRRRGLSRAPRRRARTPVYEGPFSNCTAPNQVWCADFKGWFRTGDQKRCHPLTLSDAHSRYLLRCEALLRTDFTATRCVFRSAFEEYGLPAAIRTDNGAPFASRAPGGLSRLSVWLIKVGIVPERIAPGKPTQNGRHERMHRTLKAEAASPPKRTRLAQQRALDAFRLDYNQIRPHEALGQIPPAEVYQASARPFPYRLDDPLYPDSHELHRIRGDGTFRWLNRTVIVTELIAGELIGLERGVEDTYRVWFGPIVLGTVERNGRFRAKR
jgi:transposase InsO family protein